MNPKSGKSTLAYNLFKQDGLFLGFEDGTRALSGALAVPVSSWDDLVRDKKVDVNGEKVKRPSINKQLKNPDVQARYKVLILDTIDLAYEQCVRYVCEQEGVDDILDIPFGKGLKIADDIFKDQLLEWERLGYKLFFISHAEDKKLTIKDHKGVEREIVKFTPSLHKRAFKIVSKMVDNIFFAYVKVNENGTEERVVFTRETNVYFAGSRFKYLPSELPLDAEAIQKAISEAIEKEDLTTDEKSMSINVASTLETTEFETFEEIKNNLVELVKSKFHPAGKMDIVKEITTKQLGEGRTINGATETDIDALDAILEFLTAKVVELGL